MAVVAPGKTGVRGGKPSTEALLARRESADVKSPLLDGQGIASQRPKSLPINAIVIVSFGYFELFIGKVA